MAMVAPVDTLLCGATVDGQLSQHVSADVSDLCLNGFSLLWPRVIGSWTEGLVTDQ